jgi:hypothetical protein
LTHVSNSFYSSINSRNDCLSKVLAIYFETTDKPGNSRNFQSFLLNKPNDSKINLGYCNSKLIKNIKFSQKGNSKKVGQEIFKIINYCFGTSDIFISSNNKELIEDY